MSLRRMRFALVLAVALVADGISLALFGAHW